jgi:tetratricopeptide (TPR) repeat protein
MSEKSWTRRVALAIGYAAIWFLGGVTSYQLAKSSIPIPPYDSSFLSVCKWALSGSDKGALLTAIASGLGMVATGYQLFGPKLYTARQGRGDRQHQNSLFRAADSRQSDWHREDIRGHAETQHQLADLSRKVEELAAAVTLASPQAAAAFGETLMELSTSPDEADVAIARKAVEESSERAADALMADVAAGQQAGAERARKAGRLYAPFAPAKAISAYKIAVNLDPTDMWAWIELGRLKLEYEDIDSALACLNSALFQAVSERDKMCLHVEFGDVMNSLGHLENSRQEYISALQISESIAKEDEKDLEKLRDYTVILEKIGLLEAKEGNLDRALARSLQCLFARDAIASALPLNDTAQNDLAIALERVAVLLLRAGDAAGSKFHFIKKLEIDRKLAEKEPGIQKWQRDLAVTLDHLGAIYREESNLDLSRESFEESLSIRKRLLGNDEFHAGLKREISVSLQNLSYIMLLSGDLINSRKYCLEDLEIAIELYNRDQKNSLWTQDLVTSYSKMSHVEQEMGQMGKARVYLDMALSLADGLLLNEKGNMHLLHIVSFLYRDIGLLDKMENKLDDSKVRLFSFLEIIKNLSASDPSNTDKRRALSHGHRYLGDLEMDMGNTAAAIEHFNAALTEARFLASTWPGNPYFLDDELIAQGRLDRAGNRI